MFLFVSVAQIFFGKLVTGSRIKMKRWNDGWADNWREDWSGWGWKGKWEDKSKKGYKWEDSKWEDSNWGNKWDHADSNAHWEERRPPKRSRRCEENVPNGGAKKKLKGNSVDFGQRWRDMDEVRPKIPRPPQKSNDEVMEKDAKREKGIFALFRFFGDRS